MTPLVQSPLNLKVKAATKLFFDREAVIARVGKARAKYLNRAGAMVRLTARRSIRKSDKTSKPGSTPFSHNEHLLRNLILYALDPSRNDAMVGPAKLNKPGTAPATLEHGGEATIDTFTWQRDAAGQVTRRVRTGKKRITIAARPFMGPALEKVQPQLSKLWADTVTA